MFINFTVFIMRESEERERVRVGGALLRTHRASRKTTVGVTFSNAVSILEAQSSNVFFD